MPVSMDYNLKIGLRDASRSRPTKSSRIIICFQILLILQKYPAISQVFYACTGSYNNIILRSFLE